MSTGEQRLLIAHKLPGRDMQQVEVGMRTIDPAPHDSARQMGQLTARRPKIIVSGGGTGIVSQAGALLLAQGCGPHAALEREREDESSLVRLSDRCRGLAVKISVKVERPQRSEDVRP